MSEQRLGQWHKRPYGWRADGVVETADHLVNVTARKPRQRTDSGLTYIMANGWTAGKNSMRVPAVEATAFGHTAVTLEYTNKGTAGALAANVKDFVAVVEAQPQERRRAAMGLSMGGAVVTLALKEIGSQVETADLVAPGKYIKDEYGPLDVVRRFVEEGLEVFEIGRNPRRAIGIGVTSAANCVRRPMGVVAELTELLDGTIHEDLRQVKAGPESPFIRFSYGLNDRLLPPGPQSQSIVELPFDEVMPYEGGHGRLAYDPALAHEIFARNVQLTLGQEVPIAAAA